MHTAGKVFTFLNVLVTLGFLFLTAPVVNYRVEKRRDIDSTNAKVKPLETQIEEAVRQQAVLRADIDREKGRVTFTQTAGLNQRQMLDARITVLTDLVNDSQTKLKTWTASVADVQTENNSRAQEIDTLNATIVSAEKNKGELTANVNDLTDRLAKAKADLAKNLAKIEEHHQRILQLEESARGKSASAKLAEATRP
ncbi:MAG: hypothetical protein U1D30_21545 [Planctomycetota bacterium]